MDHSDYTKIFNGNFIVVQLIVEKLSDAGISPIIKDDYESQRLSGFPIPSNGIQELYVNNEELDTAVPIVESVTSELQA